MYIFRLLSTSVLFFNSVSTDGNQRFQFWPLKIFFINNLLVQSISYIFYFIYKLTVLFFVVELFDVLLLVFLDLFDFLILVNPFTPGGPLGLNACYSWS